jgi:UDP-glucose 4-epimerase
MNVLLTGGTGYIGSHTAVVLSKLGYQIILYDNLSNSSSSEHNRIEKLCGHRIPLAIGDVRDTEKLLNVLSVNKIQAVIHFAGLKAVGESVAKPIDYYSNNVQGTISLLQAMRELKIAKLVFSSSATVYGEPQYLPLDENHPISTTSPYGRSKLHIEEMLKDIAKSSSEWRIACLRYFNPVGAHESGLIGENPSGLPNNLMPYIAQVAVGHRKELSVFGGDYPTSDGTGVRDYIHVMDLVEGHAAALNFLNQVNGWHAINLGTGKGYTVLEMVAAFEKGSGRKVPYKIIPRRAGDIAECFSNPLKAKKILNWTANRTLEEMCSSSWHFQQSLGKELLDD